MPHAHAFSWMAAGWRLPVLLLTVVATVGVAVPLNRQGQPLKESVAGGIVSYEFAWTRIRAESILVSWRPLRAVAVRQIKLDFLFLALYPVALALGCALLSQSAGGQFAAVGAFLSYAILAAAPLDATENIALYRMLTSGATETLARLAGVCAGLKFTLVFAGLGYLFLQGLAVLAMRVRAHS